MERLQLMLPQALNLPRAPLSYSSRTPRFSHAPPRTKWTLPSFLVSGNPLPLSPPSLPVQFTTSGSRSSVRTDPETAEWAMQDFYALRKDVQATAERVDEIRASAGLERLEDELAVLEKKAADGSLWDNPSKAQEILLALTDVKEKIKLLTDFKKQVPSLTP